MTRYNQICKELQKSPKVWLITGVAGFIGSNLLQSLLKLDQIVVGLDNFSTGFLNNLHEVKDSVTLDQWARFKFVEGDICDFKTCKNACEGIEYVLHQAALGSVPRSIENPIATNETNISGFLNILVASKDANVKSFTYAASSSTYGDHPALPKIEQNIGNPLSPYAVTKYVNELYSDVFGRCYGFKSIGLRYFNVFGPRQNPNGAYAAVIPKWIATILKKESVVINGDGETSRDFTYVNNVIQANILAAVNNNPEASGQVYNVAVGKRITLNELYDALGQVLTNKIKINIIQDPIYSDFRAADVRHSLANIDKINKLLKYQPTHNVLDGLNEAMDWYLKYFNFKYY